MILCQPTSTFSRGFFKGAVSAAFTRAAFLRRRRALASMPNATTAARQDIAIGDVAIDIATSIATCTVRRRRGWRQDARDRQTDGKAAALRFIFLGELT